VERYASFDRAGHIDASRPFGDGLVDDPTGLAPVVDGDPAGNDRRPAQEVLGVGELWCGGQNPRRRLLDDLLAVGGSDAFAAQGTVEPAGDFGPNGLQADRKKFGNHLAPVTWDGVTDRFPQRRISVKRVQRRSPSLRARLVVGAAFLPLLTVFSQVITAAPAHADGGYCVYAYPQSGTGTTLCTP
jgi:hypothetical protein